MKSNIEIVKDYLAGVRPVIQVGYTGKKYVKRANGETWTDDSGQDWEQRSGGAQKVNRVANIIREAIGVQKCRCGQEVKWGSKRDRLFYNRTGLCEGCLIDYETKLRVLGIYPDYETYKMASNELGSMKDFKSKIDETIKYFTGRDTDVTMLCNSEGFIERWKTTNKDEILENAKKDLTEVSRRIEALTKIRDECKQKYEASATKFNLEILCQTEKLAIKT
jgi:hypothetical protein